MDGGRRTESFQCLLSGHTADMANTSPGVILGCLFLAKKGKEKEYKKNVYLTSSQFWQCLGSLVSSRL